MGVEENKSFFCKHIGRVIDKIYMGLQNELKLRPITLTRADLQLFPMLRDNFIILLKKSTKNKRFPLNSKMKRKEYLKCSEMVQDGSKWAHIGLKWVQMGRRLSAV